MIDDNRPLISYVVTAYNLESFIAESIECAFAQTYQPLEIILSDDCSTDRTYEIMQEKAKGYNGPHTVILNRNERNLGITCHMNRAYLELPHGEWIVAAHGDDISKPDRVEKAWEYLQKHQDTSALSFSMDAINETGQPMKQHSAVVDRELTYTFETGGNIPAPSRCFSKKVMEIFGPMGEDCPTEDEVISFRSLMLGKNVFLPQHMVLYRKHKGSASNPENFPLFPLSLILKQQKTDMEKAVLLGLITEEDYKRKLISLEKNMHIRDRYRKYYSDRSFGNLLVLLSLKDVGIKRKMCYIKEHMLFFIRR